MVEEWSTYFASLCHGEILGGPKHKRYSGNLCDEGLFRSAMMTGLSVSERRTITLFESRNEQVMGWILADKFIQPNPHGEYSEIRSQSFDLENLIRIYST